MSTVRTENPFRLVWQSRGGNQRGQHQEPSGVLVED